MAELSGHRYEEDDWIYVNVAGGHFMITNYIYMLMLALPYDEVEERIFAENKRHADIRAEFYEQLVQFNHNSW